MVHPTGVTVTVKGETKSRAGWGMAVCDTPSSASSIAIVIKLPASPPGTAEDFIPCFLKILARASPWTNAVPPTTPVAIVGLRGQTSLSPLDC